MAPTMLQDAPRPLQDGSELPQEVSRRPKPQEIRCACFLSLFRFPWPSEASRWLQDGPRGLQEGLKRAQGGPKSA
eukprot:959089-Pyramimonas_sp.AAC.1